MNEKVMSEELIQHVSDTEFYSEVIESKIPVLVDFWAPWCGPCRQMNTILNDLALDLKGKVKVAKVNLDENPVISDILKIQAIPTLAFFSAGKLLAIVPGVRGKKEIIEILNQNNCL